jgi:hypothetical protein
MMDNNTFEPIISLSCIQYSWKAQTEKSERNGPMSVLLSNKLMPSTSSWIDLPTRERRKTSKINAAQRGAVPVPAWSQSMEQLFQATLNVTCPGEHTASRARSRSLFVVHVVQSAKKKKSTCSASHSLIGWSVVGRTCDTLVLFQRKLCDLEVIL